MTRSEPWHPAVDDPQLSTRRRVLVALKIMGEATAQELAERLRLTPMGVRRHLTALENEEMVSHYSVRHGQGRPKHIYHLTAKAQAAFEQRYAALSVELLRYIAEEFGDEVVQHLFERRAQRRIAEAMPYMEGRPLRERVHQLVTILDREGYLAEWHTEDHSYIICEHHCAIRDVAQSFPEACATEMTFIKTVLGDVDVERVEHIISGSTCCSYRIRARAEEETV